MTSIESLKQTFYCEQITQATGHFPKKTSPQPLLQEGQSVSSMALAHHLWVWLFCVFGLVNSSSGSDTGSPQWAHHKVQSPSFSELVCLGERNTKLFTEESLVKWNICTGAFVVTSDTRMQSSVNSHSLYTIISSSIPLVIFLCLSQLFFLLHVFLSPLTCDPIAFVLPFVLYFFFNFHAVYRTD